MSLFRLFSLIPLSAVIGANKMDRPKADANLERLRNATPIPVVPLSAQYGKGVLETTSLLRQHVEKFRPHKPSKDADSVADFARMLFESRNKKT